MSQTGQHPELIGAFGRGVEAAYAGARGSACVLMRNRYLYVPSAAERADVGQVLAALRSWGVVKSLRPSRPRIGPTFIQGFFSCHLELFAWDHPIAP
jgi:hypothetical protein